MMNVLEDAKIEGKSLVRRLLVHLVQRRRDEATTKVVAVGMKGCVCANLRFLRGVDMTGFCGELHRNVERDWGI